MVLNIHPIFVHFPIALLTVYALMEIARFRKIIAQHWWFYTKAVFAIIGSAGAGAALFTGQLAERSVSGSQTRALLHLHSRFAYASSAIFGIVALAYLIAWIDKSQLSALQRNTGWKKFVKIIDWFLGWPVIIVALAGLACITITGALGGALVYGPDIDPVVSMIYHVFFP